MSIRFMHSLPILMLFIVFQRNPAFFIAMLPYLGWALVIVITLTVISAMIFTVYMLFSGFTKAGIDDAAELDEQAEILRNMSVQKEQAKKQPANA